MSTTVISSKTQQRVRQPAIQLNVPHARAEPQGLPAKTAAASTSPPSDPHYLPTFTPSAPPSTPILYLPRLHPQHHADPPSAGRHPWDRARGGSTPPSAAATLALHKALHRFRPATEDCAHAPFEAAFNWAELALPEDAEAEWFAVAFYSRHAHGAGGPCYELNAPAHAEALRTHGLIMYWASAPHGFAACLWRTPAHAVAANSGPHHLRALRAAAGACARLELRRFRVCKRRGERGLRVEAADGGDAGW